MTYLWFNVYTRPLFVRYKKDIPYKYMILCDSRQNTIILSLTMNCIMFSHYSYGHHVLYICRKYEGNIICRFYYRKVATHFGLNISIVRQYAAYCIRHVSLFEAHIINQELTECNVQFLTEHTCLTRIYYIHCHIIHKSCTSNANLGLESNVRFSCSVCFQYATPSFLTPLNYSILCYLYLVFNTGISLQVEIQYV